MARCLAVVAASEAQGAAYLLWVRPQSPADCQACAEGRGCGGGLLAKALRRDSDMLVVPSEQAYAVGDQLYLDVPDEALLWAALRFYLLPLLALLMLAGGARASGLGESLQILAGCTGLALAWLGLRLNFRRHGHTLLPIALLPAGTGARAVCSNVQNKSA